MPEDEFEKYIVTAEQTDAEKIVYARFCLNTAKHYGKSNLEFLSQMSNSGMDITDSDFERVLAYNIIKNLSPRTINLQNVCGILEAEEVLLSLAKPNDFVSRDKRTSIPKEPRDLGDVLEYTKGE